MLILGGISGAGMTAFVKDNQPIFMVVTFGFLALAFYLTYRPRSTTTSGGEERRAPASRMMALNKIMLWAVTVMAVVFLFGGPYLFNPDAVPTAEFTPEMTRTVIQIEGMS
ncbi:MAG: hypothetical protein IIA67_05330 [Planctomycetes bacterium]|nr:hypothetical protein [Planctomycetota bacterium]